MMELFSIQFWIVILFFINFFLAIFIFVLMKKINRLKLAEPEQAFYGKGQDDVEFASGSASEIIEMLEPLVEESRKAAISFNKQIKEKKRLLKGLNDALDSRIININLLLSRADALQKKLEEKQAMAGQTFSQSRESHFNPSPGVVFNQQNQILEMYDQNFDIDAIAQRLAVPKGEVQLVIDLKKKFIAMEKNSR